jgi:hypothetical protein
MPVVLERATFAEHLGETFRTVLEPGNQLELELVEVEALGSASPDDPPRRESFSIVFRGPKDKTLAQGTFRMEHDVIGSFDLFLVPISEDQDGRQYEAVFN